MRVFAITPDSSVSEVEGLLEVAATPSESSGSAWEARIRGANADDSAKNQAMIAIDMANNVLPKQSSMLSEWLAQTSKRRITFAESLGQAGPTQLGVGFAVRHALCQIEEFINSEMVPQMVELQQVAPAQDQQEVVVDQPMVSDDVDEADENTSRRSEDEAPILLLIVRRTEPVDIKMNLVVVGILRDGDQNLHVSPVDPQLLQSVIRSAESLEDHCKILLPTSRETQQDAMREFAENHQAELVDVRTIDDVYRVLLRFVAREVYEQGVVSICKTVDHLLAEYEMLEARNEEFMDEYTVQVIRPGARLICLEHRRSFYEVQLKEMKAAKSANQRVSLICDELRSILGKPGTDFGEDDINPDSPLGEHDLDDDDEDEVGGARGRRRNDYDDALILFDAKRRFKSGPLFLEHPDHGGDAERFNTIKRRAEEDPLLMQAYVLRYWPRYVEWHRKPDEKVASGVRTPSRNDMSDFDNVSEFLHQARQVLDQLTERYRKRQTDHITVERVFYERGGQDSVKKEHEEIIAATRQIGRDIRRLLKEIRGLCAETKT